MSKKFFDFLRILQIVLPGVAAFYVAMAKIWGWGLEVEIASSVSAFVALLGVLLKIESTNYFKNKLIIEEDEK